VPAAAVIPAPIAYTKVVAVKKLVVGFLGPSSGPAKVVYLGVGLFCQASVVAVNSAAAGLWPFTLKKLECSKQANAVNTLAWNNKIGLRFYFVGF
jgi:hypothetical protein